MTEIEKLKQENTELRIRNMQLQQMNEKLIVDKASLMRRLMETTFDAIYGGGPLR